MTSIAIDPGRVLGQVDRNVFGGFVEHLGRCIYGGLYEEGSPLSDDRGFRKDVLGLLRELRMGVLRWPGGNFVSNYHWQDGIGPADVRPPPLKPQRRSCGKARATWRTPVLAHSAASTATASPTWVSARRSPT